MPEEAGGFYRDTDAEDVVPEPDFSYLDGGAEEGNREAQDALAAEQKSHEQITEAVSEGAPSEETKAATEDSSEHPPIQPAVDPWQQIREAHPNLTLDELTRIMDRGKNTESDYTRKTQTLAEERKAFQTRQEEFQNRIEPLAKQLDFLQSEDGKKVLELSKLQKDPVMWERVCRALDSIQLTGDEVTDAIFKSFESKFESRMAEMEKKFEAQAKAIRDSEVEALSRKFDQALESLPAYKAAEGDNKVQNMISSTFNSIMQSLVQREKVNGTNTSTDALLAEAKTQVEDILGKLQSVILSNYKDQKKTEQRVLPTGSRGGSSAPVKTRKPLDINSTDEDVIAQNLAILDGNY